MKGSRKEFAGGYKFSNFEGSVNKHIERFKTNEKNSEWVKEFGSQADASGIFDALGISHFVKYENGRKLVEGKSNKKDVLDIVVNIVETEPYGTIAMQIFKKNTVGTFMRGLEYIHQNYPYATVTIVLDDEKFEIKQNLEMKIDRKPWLQIETICAKYPAHQKELLVPTVLGKKYPFGYSAPYIGLLELNVENVFQVAKVIEGEKALNTTYVALAGPGWLDNKIYEVPVGTSLKDLTKGHLKDIEVRLVKNSVMTGAELTLNDRITYDTNVIIAIPEDRERKTLFFLRGGKEADSFTNTFISSVFPSKDASIGTNLYGERRACVSCTYCESVCPVDLSPHLLYKHGNKNIYNKRLAEYRIFDCIECGLCDYVCLSKIELTQNIKKAKHALEENDISHKTYVLPYCEIKKTTKEIKNNE